MVKKWLTEREGDVGESLALSQTVKVDIVSQCNIISYMARHLVYVRC